MDTVPRTSDRGLAARLRLAVVRLNRRLRAQNPPTDVTLTQLSAMSTLHKCGPMTPGQLAAKEGVQPPSMTRVIAALEKMGYVERRAHPTDGRQAIVELSRRGVDYVKATITAREAWLDEQLAKLTPQERQILDQAAELIQRMAEQ
ncbi:MarR family winged helix-turn-helix transcriptional regulator [Thermocrispum agreste]|uniref:MarR family winged helix-turn-helix transcriptional regulator n=1 Tax=Thermocrispum agreste TaxID=37925 RepID=UPI0004027EA0|nr:MarR family transcriptional regulator [Thermocrispum agreste]